jgi:beta-lactamase regulating signal transducer with metallopeptidase domain/Tol biopolymer transport system component
MEVLLSPLVLLTEWLLKTSVQASVLIALVFAVQWVFPKWLSPSWRYRLWLLVVIRLMLPIAPGSAFSVFNYTETLKTLALAARVKERSVSILSNSTDTRTSVASAEGMNTSNSGGANARSASGADRSKGSDTLLKQQAFTGERSISAAPTGAAHSWLRLLPFRASLSLLWLAGALVLLSRVILFPLRLNALLAKHETAPAPALFEVLEQAKRVIGINKVLPIIQSRAVKSPALMGFIRPWLLLPEGMVDRFTTQELRFVLLHELAHLKRRDIAMNWLMTLLQILHWFNPLVWVAFSRMRADRELACDAIALSHAKAGEHKSYGQAIIKLLEDFTPPAPVTGLVGILEDKRQMKRRMLMIGQFDRNPKRSALALLLVVAISLVTLTEAQSRLDQGKNHPPKQGSSITLRQLPTFNSGLDDISADGRYGLGNVVVGQRATATVPFVVNLATGVERRFDTKFEGPGTPFAWKFSPDGKQILCARLWEQGSNYSKELLLLDVETGKLRRIYRNEDIDTIWIQDWSFDGKTILAAFEKADEMKIRRKRLALISISDGTAREIKTPDNFNLGNHFACRLSPDSLAVAYNATPLGGGTSDIRLVRADGSGEVALVQHSASDVLLAWSSPNGIAFMSDRRGGWDAYVLEVRNGQPVGEPLLLRELGRGASPLRVTASGDLFFSKSTRNVDVYFATIDSASGKLQEKPIKAPRVEGHSQFPAWSPDGRSLAYVDSGSQDGVIGIRHIETGAIRELDFVAPRLSFPHWSKDDKSIHALSYSSGQGLAYRIDLDAKQATVIAKGRTLLYDAWPLWSWTPDGKSFFQWRGSKATFVRFDIESGQETNVEIPGGAGAYSCALSPDCKQLLRSVSKKNEAGEVTRTIMIVPVNGGEPRELVQLVGPEAIEEIQARRYSDQGLGWTPDGRYALFVKGNLTDQKMHSLWRVPVTGGEAESVGVEMERLRQPTISPDGHHIAFTAGGAKTELWVMENFLPPAKVAAN